MESGSITIKDIVGWIVTVVVSLVPLLIFYLKYRTDKKKLEEMLYKEINKLLKKENEELKRENEELKKKLEQKVENKTKK